MMLLYAAAIAGYIGIFAGSTPFGWSSPVLPLYKRDDSPVYINDDEGAWIASAFMLGSAFCAILFLFARNAGRKNMLIASSIPWFISWAMIMFARSPWELLIARFISGLGTGTALTVLPIYVGEIAPAKIRGILLTIIMLSSRLGILFSYVLCPFVSIRMSALVMLILPIPYTLAFIWLPESPYHSIRLGNRDDAAKSLASLRGTADIQAELNRIESSVKTEMANSGGLEQIFLVPGNRKAMTVGTMLGLLQQLSGSQAIMIYTQTIFDQANVDLEGKYLAIILGIVQVFCIGLCVIVVDRYGRRPLLLVSSIGALISTSAVATYFNLQYLNINTSTIEWLPAAGCMLYVVFYSIGLAPMPVTMLGELFPANIKLLALLIIVFIGNLVGTTVGKAYQLISDSVGTHVAFWIFTLCNVLGTIYIYFSIPETKGKTLQEIQDELHYKKSVVDNTYL